MYIHRSLVLSSLSAIHLLSFSGSRAVKPTLNGFGSVVNAVGMALHSKASKMG